MIKLFRHIRRSLLEKNQMGKPTSAKATVGRYFKYAIGEIILVVIGILIALQINTWNENRKIAANEAHILSEILNNLNEDRVQISNILKRRNIAQNSIEKLLVILNSSSLDEEGLEEHIAKFLTFERFYPLNNSFEMMKASGLMVKNKDLRTTISRYYDFEQKKVEQSITDIENVFLRLVQSDNAIRSNLKSAKTGTKTTALVKLKNPSDKIFLEVLHTEVISFNDNNSSAIDRIAEFKEFNARLINEIEQELTKTRLKRNL